MMKQTCLVLSLALWLTGCATPGAVDLPAVEVPQQWRSLPQQTVADAPAPWAALFAHPDLAALLKAARDNNRSLRAAAARVDAAAAAYGVQRAQRWPALNAQGSASRGKQPVSVGLDNQIVESTKLAGALSWELDLWGRIADQAESGRQSWLSAEETYRAAQVSLDAQVASGWLQLLELDEQLQIAERTVANQTTSRDLVLRRFKGGVVSMVDLNQAESVLAGAESTRADIRRARSQAENALALLIGQPSHAVQRSGMVSALPRPTALPVGMPSDVLLSRPDVRAAERALASTQHGVHAARKAWLPSISLSGMLGWASYDLSRVVSTGTEAWSAGGAINLPIFNGGSLMAQLDLAEARQREAAETYAGSVLQSLREVEDAIVSFQQLSEQSDALDRRVKATRERLRLADMRYRSGVTDYFEVLNAQQDLLATELNAVQASRGAQASLLQLYAALGGADSGANRTK